MKKILALILALTAVFVLAACAPQQAAPAENGQDAEAHTVFLITMDKMDRHWVTVDEGASAMAERLGLDYRWDGPDTKDTAKQIEVFNNAVAAGADLILLAANDPQAIAQAIETAQAAGVIVMYVDSPANPPATATLLTNNLQAGALAGQTMVDELNAAGKTSGKIGIIGVNTATVSTMNRENGFRQVVEEAGFTILETEYRDGDAAASQEAAQGFIVGNEDLVGLFGTNEGSSVGVGNAIKASGREIVGVGFDKSDAIMELLADGSLKASMAQNPFTMGYLGVAQAYAALNGLSTGPAVIDTGVAVLRK